AVEHRIVEKSGAWFSFQGERLGQGRENAKNLHKSDASIGSRIEAEVRKALGLTPASEELSSGTPQANAGSSRKAATKE
ncbi:MAG TPA: DNA recombination/repair protein RecA, partial [Blastocatellia bacterium]|nr:DNA recombination/repair protein RecA [Blastocatellia bacterium]